MDHPKFIAIDAGAWRLWCEGTTYCQRHLTDGAIPASVLRGFRYFTQRAQKQLLEALVPGKGPLWHKTDGGVQVHDYLEWNEPREKVLKARHDAKDRLEKWKAGKNASGNGTRNAFQNASPHPVQNASKQNGTEQVGKEHLPPGARDSARRPHPLDERPVLSPEAVDAGDRFLAVYPVKQGQKAAKRAWIALNPDEDTITAIFANLEERARLGWAQHARFLPFPGRFLEDEMWKETYIPRDAPAADTGRQAPGAEATDDYLKTLRAGRG